MRLPTRGLGIDALFDWAKEVVSRDILDGRLIEDVSVSTTATAINHLMGRTPRGVVIVKSSTTDSYKTFGFTSDSISITSSSGAAVVSLWVF